MDSDESFQDEFKIDSKENERLNNKINNSIFLRDKFQRKFNVKIDRQSSTLFSISQIEHAPICAKTLLLMS